MSHTQRLLEESASRVLEHLEESYTAEISTISTDQILNPFTAKGAIEKLLNKLGFHISKVETVKKLEEDKVRSSEKLWAVQTFVCLLKDCVQFDKAYELLADETSRETFDWCIRLRVALSFIGKTGYQLFPPPVEEKSYKKALEKILRDRKSNRFVIDGFKLKSSPDVIFGSFIAEQYRLPEIVEPEMGNFVLDIGGLFGETSFWFSKHIGEEGRVFCFEPVPENYCVLLENLKENGSKNVIPVNLAVGGKSGEIEIAGVGEGATTSNLGKTLLCTSIDDFVENQNLTRVDLIKMDIEGSEFNALCGARETLQRFKIKLAISVYHRGEDLAWIPLS